MNDMMQQGNWRIEANCCLVMCDKCKGGPQGADRGVRQQLREVREIRGF
jgi:hypothetical protein